MAGHDLACFLVVKGLALVADTTMGFGHQELGPPPVLAPALLGLELALSLGYNLFGLAVVARVVDVAPIGEGSEILQPHINAHRRTAR